MLCDECGKREAVFHSVRKINGSTFESHLCGECRSRLSAGPSVISQGFGLSELSGLFSNFSSIFQGASFSPQNRVTPKTQDRSCAACGRKFSEFLDTGFLGCDQCWHSFRDQIIPLIEKVQDSSFHRGKSPLAVENSPAPPLTKEYELLSYQLAKAVESENYEEAAVIRDRMRAIKENAGE